MNNDQTNHLPYRPTPLNMIPIEDYNKVVKELETAYNKIKKLESRKSLREGFVSFFTWLQQNALGIAAMVVMAVLVYRTWWGVKDSAHGVKARQNAEREAASYVSRRYGPVSSTVCGDTNNIYQECFVRLVDTTKPPVIVYCDDDYPNSNDGCRSSH